MFDPDAFDKMSNDFELEALRKEISKLEAEVKMLKKVIHDNVLSDEFPDFEYFFLWNNLVYVRVFFLMWIGNC